MRRSALTLLLLAVALDPARAANPVGGAQDRNQLAADKDSLTPEQRMQARFPQKVRVGDIIGLPVQDYDDRILGHVTDVARTPAGKIVLVMPEGGWFGWGSRQVGIPIETVAILGRHLNLLDLPREDLAKLPTWAAAQGTSIGRRETILIALGRR